MHLLILSFYFQPDLCAGSFRATALVKKLAEKLGPSDQLTVLTTMPNRYNSFQAETSSHEDWGNVRIVRISLPSHKSGMVDQAKAFMAYARSVLQQTSTEKYDLVFATSSRLMTAALGSKVSKRLGVPLYLDIRDIFPDTLADVFAGKPQRIVLPLLRAIEAKTIRQAARINLVSGGFLSYFQSIRDDIEYRTFTNGIDDAFLDCEYSTSPADSERKIILYAGNIGEGQGLDRVVPEAALALENDYEFWIVGDGGLRPKLEARLAEKGVKNVRIMDPVQRDRLIELYGQADVLFLHLNDYAAFHKVLPSKIFEYAATGKPILAGVGGFSMQFITENVANSALFDSCDAVGLTHALKSLVFSTTPRQDFVEKFNRDAIISLMADDILSLADCVNAKGQPLS
jgi:glycosyltransferase involved in cell wall biosynthesis